MTTERVRRVQGFVYVDGPYAGTSRKIPCQENGMPPVAHFCEKAANEAKMRGYYSLTPGTTLMKWVTVERGRLPRIFGAHYDPTT